MSLRYPNFRFRHCPPLKQHAALRALHRLKCLAPLADSHPANKAGNLTAQSGFTLIEVLVVLIITGMVSGILFQALERAYRLQERFGIELFDVQQRQMSAGWFRQTVQGLQPDYQDGPNKFKGTEREFSGLTSNPLSGGYGETLPITWKIRDDNASRKVELVYVERGNESTILSWDSGLARFTYLDEKFVSYQSWPPPFAVTTQLPKLVQLEIVDGTDPETIVAAALGPAKPAPRLLDM